MLKGANLESEIVRKNKIINQLKKMVVWLESENKNKTGEELKK